MQIFQYDFMLRAFLAGILIAVTVSCIGMVVVFRRLSMVGDALSHSSLAGVAAGLILGINPILGAVAASLAAAFAVEQVRKRMPKNAELSVAIVMSAGIGLAGVLSGFIPNAAGFHSYLFGSIIAITDFEMILITAVGILVLLAVLFLYRELFAVSFDERSARLTGVPVNLINTIFVLLTAVTVSVAARTVGALIVSSLMVVPVACAMQLERSWRGTMISSVIFAVCFTVVGLFLSFYVKLRPGGTIVLTGVVCLIVLLLAKTLAGALRARR